MKFHAIIILIFTALLASCKQSTAAVSADDAARRHIDSLAALRTPDADSLLAFVATQVAFGPRTPGSRGHADTRQWLQERLSAYGVDKVTVQEAPVTLFDGSRHTAYNILARTNPEANRRILLVAHYDTRPWADQDTPEHHDTPIDGANDGASGVAVLLEVARQLQEHPLDSLGVDLLMVDLEDSGDPAGGNDESWCLGTQAWVDNLPYDNRNRPLYGILLDMVGGRGATFPREYISQQYARTVNDKVWALANSAGLASRFPNSTGGSVIDDHLFINRAGIPCIDIIESANPITGSFNPTWHTLGDTLDAIDPATLRDVATLVLLTLSSENSQSQK